MDDILMLGTVLTVLNVIYALVGFFGSTKEAEAAKSTAHGTNKLSLLGDAVDELTQQAVEIARRTDAVSQKKRSLFENRIKVDAEAAVEAVNQKQDKRRREYMAAVDAEHNSIVADLTHQHGIDMAAKDDEIQRQLEEFEAWHEAEMRSLEDQLTGHFAAVLGKVATSESPGASAGSGSSFKFQSAPLALSQDSTCVASSQGTAPNLHHEGLLQEDDGEPSSGSLEPSVGDAEEDDEDTALTGDDSSLGGDSAPFDHAKVDAMKEEVDHGISTMKVALNEEAS